MRTVSTLTCTIRRIAAMRSSGIENQPFGSFTIPLSRHFRLGAAGHGRVLSEVPLHEALEERPLSACEPASARIWSSVAGSRRSSVLSPKPFPVTPRGGV